MGIITTTLKQKWTEFILHAINNPKTTLSGLSSFIAIGCLTIVPLIPPTWKIVSSIVAIVAALNKLYIGLISKDTGSASVITPQNPTPHAEPSTEVPLNPDATLVTTK